jgi:Ras-related protein Rab-1A
VPTIGVDFKIRAMAVGGRQVKLQIWDTAGQERFQAIASNYYRGSHAIAVVYDVTDRASFDALRRWLADVERLAGPAVCKMIVANKCDLADRRVVAPEEGRAFADNVGVPYVEASAKTGQNVAQVFAEMCAAIAERQAPRGPQGPGGLGLTGRTVPIARGAPRKGCLC